MKSALKRESPDALNDRPHRVGYLCVVLCAALWASSGTAAKFLFLSNVSPLQLVQLRTTIAAAALFLWFLAGKRDHLRIEIKDLPYLVLLGLALAVSQFAYLYAISRINVAAAILLQYQAPVLIAGHALFFARRRPSSATIMAIIGAISGCYFMVGGYSMNILTLNSEGIISGLVSALAFAVYTVGSEKRLHVYSPWTILFYALVFAALLWNIAEPPFEAFSAGYSLVSWAWISYIALFGTVLAFGLYNEGIKLVGPTHASITATLEPVIAGVISFIFLGEILQSLQVSGAGLVIVSILLLQIRRTGRTGSALFS